MIAEFDFRLEVRCQHSQVADFACFVSIIE